MSPAIQGPPQQQEWGSQEQSVHNRTCEIDEETRSGEQVALIENREIGGHTPGGELEAQDKIAKKIKDERSHRCIERVACSDCFELLDQPASHLFGLILLSTRMAPSNEDG